MVGQFMGVVARDKAGRMPFIGTEQASDTHPGGEPAGSGRARGWCRGRGGLARLPGSQEGSEDRRAEAQEEIGPHRVFFHRRDR